MAKAATVEAPEMCKRKSRKERETADSSVNSNSKNRKTDKRYCNSKKREKEKERDATANHEGVRPQKTQQKTNLRLKTKDL